MVKLALYLHLPFCRQRCRYCSFISTAGRTAEMPAYVRALVSDIGLRRRVGAQIETVYFGGGTPSLLESSQVGEILDAIRANYAITDNAEVTLEVNPGTVNGTYLRLLREKGINRLSLGIQSLDEDELRLLGRQHSVLEAVDAVHQARTAGFDNLSLDFIYGVPRRDIEKWMAILQKIVGLGAEHLSLYALSLEEGTALAEAVRSGEVMPPDQDVVAQEYELAGDMLERAGYRQYEISNWARPGYESRHNLTYWTGGDYLGLGCGAHSFLNGTRYAGTDSLDEYLETLGAGRLVRQVADSLTPRMALGEAVMLGLRLNVGVMADDIRARFGIDLQEHFKTEIAELVALGLLEEDKRRLRLTPRGRLLGNEVFIRFLPA